MKLQILIPQYQETDEIIKPLLGSIALQQSVDLNEVGVIITNDGSDVKLSEDLLNSYPYKIEYYQNEHLGVSATRNACLDHATADYVMFCDADDMFYNVCGLYIVFREIDDLGGFDALISSFLEETRMPDNKNKPIYITRELDSTFVHGKFYRRKYLIKNKIRFNPNLVVYENISDTLVKAYSDKGMMIFGGSPEGLYAEAIDLISLHRTYKETDIPVPEDEELIPPEEQ